MNNESITVEVRVDLRVETLMGAVALATPRLPQQGWIDHPVRRAALRQWRGLSDHPAPRLVRQLLTRRFWVDDLLRMMAALVEERGGALHARFPSIPDAPSAVAACDEFGNALIDFAEQSKVLSLVKESSTIAAEVITAIGGQAAIGAWAERCRAVLGEGPKRVCVFPSPLCGAHLGYGPTISVPGMESEEAWTVFGPVWRPHRRLWQLVGFQSPKLRRVVRHELGHAHLNRHTAAAGRLVAEYENLFEQSLRKAMRPYGYNRWDVCLNEHVLRAVEACFVREEDGAAAEERYLRDQERKGFALVRAFARALLEIPLPLAHNYSEFLYHLARFAKGGYATGTDTANLYAAG